MANLFIVLLIEYVSSIRETGGQSDSAAAMVSARAGFHRHAWMHSLSRPAEGWKAG